MTNIPQVILELNNDLLANQGLEEGIEELRVKCTGDKSCQATPNHVHPFTQNMRLYWRHENTSYELTGMALQRALGSRQSAKTFQLERRHVSASCCVVYSAVADAGTFFKAVA